MKNKQYFPLLIFIFPTILILVNLDNYAYSQTSPYSDLTISHIPYAEFIRNSITQYKQIPFWYPGLFGGIPLLAHPLSGIWYPLGWSGIILPAPVGFNLAFAFHMLIAGWGMYLFLKRERIGEFGAIAGGLAFELLPKIMAHWAAGHVSFCYAFCLTPWLLIWETMSPPLQKWKYLLPTTIVFSLIIFADIRWAAYSGFLWIAFRFYKLMAQKEWRKSLADWFVKSVMVMILSVFLTGPYLFNFIEFTQLSTRIAMNSSDTTQFGLPVAQLLGMTFPDFGGFAEWIFYPGALSIILGFMILFSKKTRKMASFWLILALTSLLLALGTDLTGRIPFLSLLRVSSRFLFLFDFAFAVLLGIGVDIFLKGDELGNILQPISWLTGAGISFLVLLLGAFVFIITGEETIEITWGMTFFGVSLLVLFLYRYLSIRKWMRIGIFVVLITLDLGASGYGQIRWVDNVTVYNEGLRIATELYKYQVQGRGYSTGYQIPQLAAERSSLEMISGIDPMQLKDFVSIFYPAINIPYAGYSVAIPPLTANPIQASNLGIKPDAEIMGWLNVGWMVTNTKVENAEPWIWLGAVDETEIYKNPLVRPRAWVQTSRDVIDQNYQHVESIELSPNEIFITAIGPGVLVLSDNAYPGWIVSIDGELFPIEKVEGLLRSVEIPEGEHQILFSFSPRFLKIGFITQIFGIVIIIIIASKKNA